jgi:hypothetical protein
VPLTDPFAFTPKKAMWIDHEWLSGALFYQASQLGGDWLLFAGKVVLAGVTVLLLIGAHRVSRQRDTVFLPLLALTVVPSFYVWASTVRSQVFTYLCLALLLWALANYDRHGRRAGLLSLPLVFLFWSNAHGGFVAGLGLLGLYVVGRRLERPRCSWLPELVLAGCLAATFINPYPGLSYWRFILGAVTMSRPGITEWGTGGLLSPLTMVVHVCLALFVVGWWRLREERRRRDLLMMLVAAMFAYRHQRLHAIFLFVAAVPGAPYIEHAWHCLTARVAGVYQRLARASAVAMVLALVALAGNAALQWWRMPVPVRYDSYPVAATDWLREHAPVGKPGRLLVGLSLGSYALWRLHPAYLVSLDGRYEEVYADETYGLVHQALDPSFPGHRAALAAIRPDYILLPAASRTSYEVEWTIAYRDANYVVLGRANLK